MRKHGLRWCFGVATLSDVDADGFIGIQLDGLGDDAETGLPPFELQHTFGFASRPEDPDNAGIGCGVLCAFEGDDGHAWLAADPRHVATFPSLSKGASAQYSATGAFSHMAGYDDDGTWTCYVPCAWSGTTVTQAHLVQVGLDSNGKRVINIIHADGYSIACKESEGIQIRTSDTTTFVNVVEGKVTVAADQVWIKSGGVILGAVAMAPIPGVNCFPVAYMGPGGPAASSSVFVSA